MHSLHMPSKIGSQEIGHPGDLRQWSSSSRVFHSWNTTRLVLVRHLSDSVWSKTRRVTPAVVAKSLASQSTAAPEVLPVVGYCIAFSARRDVLLRPRLANCSDWIWCVRAFVQAHYPNNKHNNDHFYVAVDSADRIHDHRRP